MHDVSSNFSRDVINLYLTPAVPSQQPILILGGERNILAASANDMLSDPVKELYGTKHIITGKYKKEIFFSVFLPINKCFRVKKRKTLQ